MGIIELIPAASFNNPATVVRVLRLLRPSRAMRKAKLFIEIGMLVQLLVGCIPMLTNVLGLLVFIFFAFGILGVQVFQGFYRGRLAIRPSFH
jgi:voltage-dependent calcium channel L type alpha-1D